MLWVLLPCRYDNILCKIILVISINNVATLYSRNSDLETLEIQMLLVCCTCPGCRLKNFLSAYCVNVQYFNAALQQCTYKIGWFCAGKLQKAAWKLRHWSKLYDFMQQVKYTDAMPMTVSMERQYVHSLRFLTHHVFNYCGKIHTPAITHSLIFSKFSPCQTTQLKHTKWAHNLMTDKIEFGDLMFPALVLG